MKYCVKCGHELAEGAKFCPTCGNAVDSNTTGEGAKSDNSEATEKVAATQSTPEVAIPKSEQTANGYSTTSETNEGAQPQLGFVGSIQYIMQHVFEFNGGVPESRKSVFWWGFLAVYLLNFVSLLIPGIGEFFVWLTAILLVSAGMRRLDYIGKNTGIAWLMMIPLVAIYPMILMFFDKKE